MNNTTTLPRFIFSLIAALLMATCIFVPAAADEQSLNEPGTHPFFAVAGNASETAIVFSQTNSPTPSFRLVFSGTNNDRFTLGPHYNGRPTAAMFLRHRLHIYLDNGRCFSYAANTTPRTERSLPQYCIALAAAAFQDRPFVLAQVQQTIILPYIASPSLSDTTSPPPSASITDNSQNTNNTPNTDQPVPNITTTSAGTLNSITFQPNNLILLTLDQNQQWVSITPQSLPLPNCPRFSLALTNNHAHIFALQPTAQSFCPPYQLLYCVIDLDSPASPQLIVKSDLPNIIDIQALVVTNELRLALAVPAELSSSDPCTSQLANFRFCTPTDPCEPWILTDRLQTTASETLTAPPQFLRFCPFNNVIAAFSWDGHTNLVFGQYSTDGDLVAPLSTPISIITLEIPSIVAWIFSERTAITLTMLAAFIIFYRRKEVFADIPLPVYVQLAPLWRRAAAFILDALPAIFLNSVIATALAMQYGIYHKLEQVPVWPPEELQQFLAQNPLLLKIILISSAVSLAIWIAYCSICETFMSATLGKKALSLVVIDTNYRKLNSHKALIRNVFRAIGLFGNLQFITLILLLFTKRHQRLGDILARTMVVLQNPTLRNALVDPDNIKPSTPPETEQTETDQQDNP